MVFMGFGGELEVAIFYGEEVDVDDGSFDAKVARVSNLGEDVPSLNLKLDF